MIEIMRAATCDLDELLPLVAGYRAFYEQTPDPDAERAFLRDHLERGTSVVFVARDERRNAVGFAQLFRTYSTVWLGPALILEDMFVAPESRGAGVAAKILARVLQYARETGAVGMFLETAADNVAAQRVYERAGWSREGRFYKYNAPL